ncbi:MAG: hypothetical protein PHE79_01920 [Eubacteriales bacterium]|nr:hypothetical protein [Eubacteriales bacterium]
MITEFDEIMRKTALCQVADYIKNGDPSDVNGILTSGQDSFRLMTELEATIKSKLSEDESESLIEEVNSFLFRIENISFQQGVRVGAKLLKELLQI